MYQDSMRRRTGDSQRRGQEQGGRFAHKEEASRLVKTFNPPPPLTATGGSGGKGPVKTI
jgi:hypothetical protein